MCLYCPFIDTTVDDAAKPSQQNDGNIYANVTTPVYGNIDDLERPYDPEIPVVCPVPVVELGSHVSRNHSNMNTGFKDQYKVIKPFSDTKQKLSAWMQYKYLVFWTAVFC